VSREFAIGDDDDKGKDDDKNGDDENEYECDGKVEAGESSSRGAREVESSLAEAKACTREKKKIMLIKIKNKRIIFVMEN
jgi:hypothetical protein